MDSNLQNALQNLIKNQATSDELELLRRALASGQIFIGGNVHNSVIIVGSGNTIQLSPEAVERLAAVNYLSALHELPQPPADFVGRSKELKKILTNIEKKGGAAISGLIGMAGIGKTVLGLVVAHSLVNKYSDAQFFIDLCGTSDNPLKPLDVMKQVVQSFHPTADLRNATEEELSGAYQSSLAEKKTILFLDNAHDASQIMPLRPHSNSLMLVTSRLHFTIPGLHSVELDILNKSEAIRLLKEICPRLTKKDAQLIADLCGNLPIALRLAGSYLQIHVDWSVEEYIAELTDKTKRLPALHLEGAEVSIESMFEQSYVQLSEEEKRYWSMLSIFPVSFKRDALATVWNLDESIARQLAGKLHQYSLLEYDSATNRYRLHDLLSDFAATKITKESKNLSFLNYFLHYRNVWNTAESLYSKGKENTSYGLSLFDTENIHIKTSYKWALENADSNGDVCNALKVLPDFVNLARIRLHPTEQIKWFDGINRAAKKYNDLNNETKALGNIGVAYMFLGDFSHSIESFEKALEVARKAGDRKREGFWVGNLGAVYGKIGNRRKEIEYSEQALVIAREQGDRRREAGWLGNIGLAYGNLGEWRNGINYMIKSLEIAREMNDDGQIELWLGNIGSAYHSLGELNEAIKYYKQSLEIAQKIKDRHQISILFENIARINGQLGLHIEEITNLNKALEIASEIGDRQREGVLLSQIGMYYYHRGDKDKPKEFVDKALDIAQQIGDRQRECECLNTLGGLYIEIGDIIQAKKYLDRSLPISREFGLKDLEAKCLGYFAQMYQLEQKKELALKYAVEARTIFESIQSPELETIEQLIESLTQNP